MSERLTDDELMDLAREAASDGGRWPSAWIDVMRAAIAAHDAKAAKGEVVACRYKLSAKDKWRLADYSPRDEYEPVHDFELLYTHPAASTPKADPYSELANALGCDPMDSHEGRLHRARRLAASTPKGEADDPVRVALVNLCDAADSTKYPLHGPAWDRLWNTATEARKALAATSKEGL